jgi:hypothetical protein
MWVVVGPAGHPAPYYGMAFTRKELKKQNEALPLGARFARVWIVEE